MNWLFIEHMLAPFVTLDVGLLITRLFVKVLHRAPLLLAAILLTSCALRSTDDVQLTSSASPTPQGESASISTAYPLPQIESQDRHQSPSASALDAYPAARGQSQSTAAPASNAYPASLSAATSTSAAYPEPLGTATPVFASATSPASQATDTAASSTATPGQATTPRSTSTPPPRPADSSTPTLTATPVLSPTPSKTAPPLPGGGFRDDFDWVMSENWKWYYPDEAMVSLEFSPGFLRIYPQAGGLPDGKPRNLFLVNAPQGDFEIRTWLSFQPESNYQFAGLLIYQDLRNALQFGIGFADCAVPANCLGRALYFTSYQDGAPGTQTIATLDEETNQVYLRLVRQGKNYRAGYSLDGIEWLDAGVLTNPLSPDWVGLFAGQSESGFDPTIFAEFDFFSLGLLP